MENITAPIHGKILSLKVEAGQTLQAGDVVYILETMKMENEITCDEGGTVVDVIVKEGDQVIAGDVIIVLE